MPAGHPQKILILKPSSLGDVIHALPVLRLLKKRFPESQIYWWLASNLLPLLEGDPDLSGLFPFYRRRWKSPMDWLVLIRSIRQIRKKKFDWVIDLQSLARSALVAWLANGTLTVGLDDFREGASTFYDVTIPRGAADVHAVDWYLKTLPQLEVPVHWEFDWLPLRADILAGIQHKWHPGNENWIVLHPGARWSNKRWPVENYGGLVRELISSGLPLRFAILGAKSDKALGAAIHTAAPEHCLDLTGQTSLSEMIEWIRLARVMVTNDTGPMHVAAALDKPVVAVFGPTNPSRTGPYRQIQHIQRADLPCVPCMQSKCQNIYPLECLRLIRPASVALEVIWRMKAQTRQGG